MTIQKSPKPQTRPDSLGHPLPAIEEFLDALGYNGSARFVAVYWEVAGDEASYDDGQVSLCGANWGAFLAYMDHPRIRPWLGDRRWALGSSDEEATHWLCLDRAKSEGYMFTVRAARILLKSQWPLWIPDPTVISGEELLESMRSLADAIRRDMPTFDLSTHDPFASMQAERRKIEVMIAALNTVEDT